ncbi:MAG TPA: SH3 domain-containing protein [Vicinamibacteria bacterium]|nr:SH3 domain-containing protein [Vicinamibacteria bacterium]
MRRSPGSGVLAALALVWPLASCATGGVKFDLDPARTAVAEARQAGAPTRSAEAFARAETHLQEAEALEAGRNGHRDRRGAQRAADLAIVEAHCATALSRAVRQTEQTTTKAAAQVAASTAEVDRLTARIKKMEEDQHRLEDRVAVLTRDLEVTETELIRTKARLKGNETKAEASAAIAEAHILAGRLAEDKTKALVLARSEESLAKAEEQLSAGNFGAALFFASKAQDLVARVKQGGGADEAHDPTAAPSPLIPSLSSYVVRTAARVRQGPNLSDPVLGHLPVGTQVMGEAVSGEWVKVTYQGLSGWVHSSLLQ